MFICVAKIMITRLMKDKYVLSFFFVFFFLSYIKYRSLDYTVIIVTTRYTAVVHNYSFIVISQIRY